MPGLNQNRLNGLLPEERTEDTDQFSYRAFDGELTSNAATVSFTILPPNSPPQIVSEPRELASPDFLYTYPVLAVDADVGEVLSYTLLQAPAAMQVDTLGQIEWIPSMADLGDHQIILEVRDSIGKFDTQMFTLSVQPAVTVPDVVGQPQAIAEGTIAAANLQTNPVFEVYDDVIPLGQVMAQHPPGGSAAAAGDDVRIDVSRGPAPVDVPRLTGLNIGDAEGRLIASGLLLGTVTYENRDDLPLGTVITQTPAPRTELLTGAPVAVTVSGGPRLDLQVGTPLVIAGQSTTIQVIAYTNDGMIEDPQPTINLSVESDPGDTAGPNPTINGASLDTDVASMGEYRIVADLPDTMETFTTSLVVMPTITDGPDGDIFSEFAAQLEQYDDLLLQLDDAITLNDVPLIQSLDTQLLTLRDAIVVDLHARTKPVGTGGWHSPRR